MMSESAFIMRLLAASVTCAEQAGVIIRQVISRGQLGIVEKGINDLQTEADRLAQISIIRGLRQHFKTLRIIGEEENLVESADSAATPDSILLNAGVLHQSCPAQWSQLTEADVSVWVDPLDGTSEFTQGLLDHVTVLIGVTHRRRPIAGVVYQPYWHPSLDGGLEEGEGDAERRRAILLSDKNRPRCVWALKHLGYFGMERRLPPPTSPSSPMLIATTRSHGTGLVQRCIEACQPCQVIRVGGCGHKVMLLIEGKAHVYLFPSAGCKKWDTCAPEALLAEAGGELRNMFGQELDYPDEDERSLFGNSQGVLAAFDPATLQTIRSKVAPLLTEKL